MNFFKNKKTKNNSSIVHFLNLQNHPTFHFQLRENEEVVGCCSTNLISLWFQNWYLHLVVGLVVAVADLVDVADGDGREEDLWEGGGGRVHSRHHGWLAKFLNNLIN